MLVKSEKNKKKESFEDSICTFWNDFQAHHFKSIKRSLELSAVFGSHPRSHM